jgi:hypothetical protein
MSATRGDSASARIEVIDQSFQAVEAQLDPAKLQSQLFLLYDLLCDTRSQRIPPESAPGLLT